MTEAETLELAATLAETTHTAFTIYISFTFGFLVTAFLVGSKLTRFQALAAIGMYIVSAGSMALATIGWLQTLFAVKNSNTTLMDTIPILNGDAWVSGMSILVVLGMLVSIYFMWNIRHPKNNS
jgi:biotin transporter BioY